MRSEDPGYCFDEQCGFLGQQDGSAREQSEQGWNGVYQRRDARYRRGFTFTMRPAQANSPAFRSIVQGEGERRGITFLLFG